MSILYIFNYLSAFALLTNIYGSPSIVTFLQLVGEVLAGQET